MPVLHLLTPDRPVVELVAEWVRVNCLHRDAAETQLIMPTRQAGRRLRETLARQAAEEGTAVSGLRVLTPEAFVAQLTEGMAIASQWDVLLTWVEVLLAESADALPGLFPSGAQLDEEASCLALARNLHKLRGQLAENGLDMASVARGRRIPEEQGRWNDLARLEAGYRAALKRRSLSDPYEARIAAVESASLAARRVALVGVPDPLPLCVTALQAHEVKGGEIDVVVFGDNKNRTDFDEWGRPRVAWAQWPLEIPDEALHLVASSREQAEGAAEMISAYGGAASRMAAPGIQDAESANLLTTALTSRGLQAYLPDGRCVAETEWAVFLRQLNECAAGRRFPAVASFARMPLVIGVLCKAAAMPPCELFELLDKLNENHLPETIQDALRLGDQRLRPALLKLTEWFDALAQPPLAEALACILNEASECRSTLEESAIPHDYRESARLLSEAIQGLHVIECNYSTSSRLLLALLIEVFCKHNLDTRHQPDALPLQGWLELMWTPEPHLLLCDMNDGLVPGSLRGELFLPDSARERLGMRCNATRHACEAYALHVMMRTRSNGGCVDIWIPKTSVDGEPLRPSRLLLQVERAELPARVNLLFGEATISKKVPPRELAWKLKPDTSRSLERLRVTDFKAWLDCPFRFYLQRVLRMSPVDPWPLEMNALAFGSVTHEVLQAFGEAAEVKEETSAPKILEYLEASLEQWISRQYGSRPPLPVVLQQDSLRQRLRAFADVQSQRRAAGWRIADVELDIRELGSLSFAGYPVGGRIDRVDRHEETGAVMIIDYKTIDSLGVGAAGTYCHKAHIKRAAAEARTYQKISDKEMWEDLQLPLYALALRERHPEDELTCGYFLLPKNVSETTVESWSIKPELLESSRACAEGIANAIREGEFWPPARRPQSKDFEEMLLNDAASTVDWSV